jgi:nicotinamidase-related amidase
MSANLCIESHLRDAAENGFDVIVVKDATAGAGEAATQAAYVNYGFIASEVVGTAEALEALASATPSPSSRSAEAERSPLMQKRA